MRSRPKTSIGFLALFLVLGLCAKSQDTLRFELKGPQASKAARGQKGEFSGLLRLGLCTSQIYGDKYGGYNKLGLTAGVGTFTQVSKNFKFQLELNYVNRGSRDPSRPDKGDFDSYKISAHYIDIPLLFTTSISRFQIEFGICNGIYLFHNEADQISKIPKGLQAWDFQPYELAGNIGLSVPFARHWQANARFHYSILPAAGKLGFISGYLLYGGAYNNTITLSIHRLLIPKK